MNCKLCGLVIQLMSGSYSDQCAQERGFCGEPCREVYEAQMELDKKGVA